MNDLDTQWKSLAADKKIDSGDIASRAIIRSIRARSNDKLEVAKGLLLKAFSPIINRNKLNSGLRPFQGLESSLAKLSWRGSDAFGFASISEAEQAEYKSLLGKLLKEKWEDTTYTYIFTRQDLTPEQQLVQTAHCTMVLGQKVERWQHDASDLHFVIFGVPDHDRLIEKLAQVEAAGISTVSFEESDLKSDQMTSFACQPTRKSEARRKRLFDNDRLLMIK